MSMKVIPVVVVVEAARCPDARPTAAAVACRGQDEERTEEVLGSAPGSAG